MCSVPQWWKSAGTGAGAQQQQGQGQAGMALAWGKVEVNRIQGGMQFCWQVGHSLVLASLSPKVKF